MILTCPACGTQYVVKDGAIPPEGRQVRCASCRHSWHQDPEAPEIEQAAEAEAAPPPVAPVDDPEGARPSEEIAEPVAMSAPIEPEADIAEPSPDDEAPLEEEPEPIAVHVPPLPAEAEDEFTPFPVRGAPEPKKRGAAFGVVIAIVLIVLAALAFWYLAPAEWKARAGLAQSSETPLQLMMTHSDRQKLASGNELLAISGRVINPTQDIQSVPPITAQLRDAKGKLVYSWTIAPPTPSLKGGDSASFYSAEVNVPAGGDELTVTLGAPKA